MDKINKFILALVILGAFSCQAMPDRDEGYRTLFVSNVNNDTEFVRILYCVFETSFSYECCDYLQICVMDCVKLNRFRKCDGNAGCCVDQCRKYMPEGQAQYNGFK